MSTSSFTSVSDSPTGSLSVIRPLAGAGGRRHDTARGGPAGEPATGSVTTVSERTHTVALLYPGHGAQDEYAWLAEQLDGVNLPVEHTWRGPTLHDVESLLALGTKERLAPAALRAARIHGADAVMWACTSGSFVYGTAGVQRQARWIADAARVPASSTSIAFVEALRALRVTRIAVAATYPPAVTGHFVHLLTDEGFSVASCCSRPRIGEHADALSAEQVRDLIGDRFPADVQAVVVPDTALHTLRLIDDLERGLDKIVLTANQVTAWYGLRLAGWHGRVEGLGRLFL